jgi:hypothetical protein
MDRHTTFRTPRRWAVGVACAAVLCLLLPSPAPAQQDPCPGKPNAHVTGRSETKLADGTIKRTTRCACNEGFDNKDGACVAASKPVTKPVDRTAEYCRSKLKLEAHRGALRELDFESNVERFELYAKASEEQKFHAISLLVTQSAQGLGVAAGSLKSLTPWNIGAATRSLQARGSRSITRLLSEGEMHKAIDTLVLRGLKSKPVIDALRVAARTSGKPEMADAIVKVKHTAEAGFEGAKALHERHHPLYAGGHLLAGAMKLAVHNPYAALAISTAEGAEMAAFYMFLKPNVEALDVLTEDQLKRAGVLARQVKDETDALLKARREWQRAHPGKAEPACAR